ncbi:MAG: ATP-dependent helicase [Nannocystaceae bacterium]
MDGSTTPWTAEQRAILDHPSDAHALVRAVPGAGKTTTLVGRVARLCQRGADPRRIRVVMFNRAIADECRARLAALGVDGVRVRTFDSLGLEVLRAAERRGLLRRELRVTPEAADAWARAAARRQDPPVDADELADAVAFWKAHLIAPTRAAFPGREALVDAYRDHEAIRLEGGVLRVAFADMVYTAARALKESPALLGPIDHLLVDEFQDVNLARVTLMQRLIHRRTAIVAVGDEDQAINEWCGAHPRFFRDFAGLFPGLPCREYPLSRSFRLGPTLAAAATRLIAHDGERSGAAIVGGGADEGAIVEADEVPATVRALIAEGAPPATLAVLYRSREQGLAAVAGLATAGVAIETEDLERIRQSRAAALILTYLRFATSDLRPELADAWRIVHAPERYVHKDIFARQLDARGAWGLTAVLAYRPLARELGQPPTAVLAMGELAEVLQRMGRCAGVGEALAILQGHVDLGAQLLRGGRSDRPQEGELAALGAVLDLLGGLAATPAGAAHALASLDPTRGAAPDERVWVSTIHRAKGKEWRRVILPALADGLCPAPARGAVPGSIEGPEVALQSEWLAQERRIFYVGVTRASERVYVQAQGPTPSPFLAELLGATPAPRSAARSVGPAASGSVAPLRRRRSDHGRVDVDAEAPEATARRGRRRAERAGEGERSSEPRSSEPRSTKPWSANDKTALREAWARGATLDAIAAELGRSVSAVAHRVVRLGLEGDVEVVMSRRDLA